MHDHLIPQTLAQIEASNVEFFKVHQEYRGQAHKNIIAPSLLTSSRGQVDKKALSKIDSFKVRAVHDGDTLHLSINPQKLEALERQYTATVKTPIEGSNNLDIKVRLFGIDSPETDQFFGQKSSAYLRSLILNKKVQVKFLGKDIYDRYLVVVFYKGINLNFMLVKEGLAFPYYKIINNTVEEFVYKKAFAYAIRHGKGMWNPKLWTEDKYPRNPFLFKRN